MSTHGDSDRARHPARGSIHPGRVRVGRRGDSTAPEPQERPFRGRDGSTSVRGLRGRYRGAGATRGGFVPPTPLLSRYRPPLHGRTKPLPLCGLRGFVRSVPWGVGCAVAMTVRVQFLQKPTSLNSLLGTKAAHRGMRDRTDKTRRTPCFIAFEASAGGWTDAGQNRMRRDETPPRGASGVRWLRGRAGWRRTDALSRTRPGVSSRGRGWGYRAANARG